MSQSDTHPDLTGPPHPATGNAPHPRPSTPAGHQAGDESSRDSRAAQGPSHAVEYKIPVIRNEKSGLTYTRGTWKASYLADGKKRMKSLATKDLEIARAKRDEFYRTLGCDIVEKPTEKHVYRLCTYQVRVHGVYIGSYKSKRKAMQVAAAAAKEVRKVTKKKKPKKR